MRVLSARFVKSGMKPEHYPREGWPEVAFTGRSNVGKSSLLNALLRRKSLAKTSSTPGKTQTLNFFAVNEKLFLVDLPGYGYAKVPLAVKAQWSTIMLQYLREREPLKLVVALVDSRHEPSSKDFDMLDLLGEAQKPTLIVATKIDKVKPSQRASQLKAIRKALDLDAEALLIPCSVETGEGVKEIWRVIQDCVG